MSKILVENIKIYAYHGCLPEENIIGSDYLIDIEVTLDMDKAAETDDLNFTVNYAELNKMIHREMAVKSNLLENVVKRIINSTFSEFPSIMEVWVKLSKVNPPMGGDVEKVSVIMSQKRS